MAKGLIAALVLSLVPLNAAVATPATIQSITSEPSVTNDGDSVFDVSWQFDGGTLPDELYLLRCKLEIAFDPSSPTPYPVQGFGYQFQATYLLQISTPALSGTIQQQIMPTETGIYFFRAYLQQPNFAASACESEQAGVPTTAFKLTTVPLDVEIATNAFSSSQVAYTDFVTPQGQNSQTVQLATTHSAPLAKFSFREAHFPLLGNGTLTLQTLIDGAPEPIGLQNSNPCSRTLQVDDWELGRPDYQDQAGRSLWVEHTQATQSAFLPLCSWENFPMSPAEQADSDFVGREIQNQIWANLPTWFPDPVHHYGVPNIPYSMNPDLFAAMPVTAALSLDYTTGNASQNNLTLTKAGLTSATASLTMPSDQAEFDRIEMHYLIMTRSGSLDAVVLTYFTQQGNNAGETQVEQVSNLETTTYSATVYFFTAWSTWRTNTATAELSRVTVSFNVGDYSTTQSNLATFSGYVGQEIQLPAIDDPSVALFDWSFAYNTYQPGDTFMLADDTVFTANLDYRDSKLSTFSISHSVNNQIALFPAFDPNISTYYLNISDLNFEDITITLGKPRRGVISGIMHASGGSGPLVNNQTNTATSSTFTLTTADMRNFFSPRSPVNRAGIIFTVLSEFASKGRGPGSSAYELKIVRDPGDAVFDVSLSFDPEVTGETSEVDLGGLRYVTLPEQGTLAKPGFAFLGWLDPISDDFYGPGDVILVDRDWDLEAHWFDLRSINFGLDGYERSLSTNQRWIDYPLDEELDPQEVAFFYEGEADYRVSLFTPEGDLVSRFHSGAEFAQQNLNSHEDGLSNCPDQGPCLGLFKVVLDLWDQTISDGISISFNVMRTTTSNQVCLDIDSLYGPNEGLENWDCDSGPGWERLPQLDDFNDIFESDDAVFPIWKGQRLGDQRVLLGFRLDPTDLTSRLYGLGERVPLFEDVTLTAVWEVDEQNAVTEISIFGSSYLLDDCTRQNEIPAEVKCLRNMDNPEQLIYPYGPSANRFYLSQEFTANFLLASMQSGRDSGFLLDIQDENFQTVESFDVANDDEQIYGYYTDEELCPEGYCGVVHRIVVSSGSLYGTNDYELNINVLRKPQNPATLSAQFSMAGGTGLATQSIQTEIGWVMPPNIDSLKKPGFLAQNWIVRIGGMEIGFNKTRPVAIWTDSQLISVGWVPAYTLLFMDGFTDSPVAERLFRTNNAYWEGTVPTASHPLGNELLGWTFYAGSDTLIIFDSDLLIPSDATLHAVWSSVSPQTPAPNPPAQNSAGSSGNQDPRPAPVNSASPSASPVTPVTSSPSTSTAIGVTRVNGMTQVNFALPAKYVGRTATIEVKRWINNRVRYFVLDASRVQRPDATGRASLTFDFKLRLKPTDVIRIKVGKVEVFKERLTARD